VPMTEPLVAPEPLTEPPDAAMPDADESASGSSSKRPAADEDASGSWTKRPAADEGIHKLCCVGIMTAVHSDFVASYYVSATSMVPNIVQRLRRFVTLFSDILASCH
jgi:hypothetical protein